MQDVVIQAPMSYVGSSLRIWKLNRIGPAWLMALTIPVALALIAVAWVAVTIWYCFAVWLMIPYRIIRRSQRKARRDAR